MVAMVVATLLLACTKPEPAIKKAAWVLGKWQTEQSPDGQFTEIWTQKNDTLLVGHGVLMQGADTAFAEYLQIVQRGEDLFYVANVLGENNEEPVEFKLTSADKALVFENPVHDFPQKISYIQLGADSMLAEVSAMENGQEQKESFALKRVK